MTVIVQTSASSQNLKQIFQKINAQSCPQEFNFHMHTVHSDGRLQPEELVQQAIAIGLKGLAITDHHTISGYRVALRYLDGLKLSHPYLKYVAPEVWTGVEINANLLDVEVHILGYAFQPEHPSMVPYLQQRTTVGETYQAVNAIASIHQAGGLAVLAHPARYKQSPQKLIPAAATLGIDGVETFYAYNNPQPWRPSPKEMAQVHHLAKCHGLFNTCGTDTHGLSLLQRL